MEQLQQPASAELLVGTETSDDAGVYRLNDREAIVVTADFITPPSDDARLYGQIAAANSLSDVYAMGGRPLTALALCMFPKALEPDAAREILAGGQDKVVEAGAFIVGGHTVRGEELFYGLSVTGVVDPLRLVRNVGARPGDALVLTKPLGSGLVVNGLRKEAISEADARPTLEILARLNRAAAETVTAMLPRVHAMTDITGFGLVGHALGMTRRRRRLVPHRSPVAAAVCARARHARRRRHDAVDQAQSRARRRAACAARSIHSGTRWYTIRKRRAGFASPSMARLPTSWCRDCATPASSTPRASARCARPINRSSSCEVNDGPDLP